MEDAKGLHDTDTEAEELEPPKKCNLSKCLLHEKGTPNGFKPKGCPWIYAAETALWCLERTPENLNRNKKHFRTSQIFEFIVQHQDLLHFETNTSVPSVVLNSTMYKHQEVFELLGDGMYALRVPFDPYSLTAEEVMSKKRKRRTCLDISVNQQLAETNGHTELLVSCFKCGVGIHKNEIFRGLHEGEHVPLCSSCSLAESSGFLLEEPRKRMRKTKPEEREALESFFLVFMSGKMKANETDPAFADLCHKLDWEPKRVRAWLNNKRQYLLKDGMSPANKPRVSFRVEETEGENQCTNESCPLRFELITMERKIACMRREYAELLTLFKEKCEEMKC